MKVSTLTSELICCSVQWYTLGALLGVPVNLLDEIEQSNQRANPKKCLVSMLDAWLKTGEESYNVLIIALINLEETSLAKEIATKHGKINDFYTTQYFLLTLFLAILFRCCL